MKWLLVLAIIAAVIGYLVYRYRKYLQSAWFMYSTFRRMKKGAKTARQKQVPARDTSMDAELVRCPVCDKWSSKEDTVKLKGQLFCSLVCLEESMAGNKVPRT
jgi:hypothetical protein